MYICYLTLSELLESTYTSFLHEGEEVIQKLLPFRVIVQFIQLKGKMQA